MFFGEVDKKGRISQSVDLLQVFKVRWAGSGRSGGWSRWAWLRGRWSDGRSLHADGSMEGPAGQEPSLHQGMPNILLQSLVIPFLRF